MDYDEYEEEDNSDNEFVDDNGDNNDGNDYGEHQQELAEVLHEPSDDNPTIGNGDNRILSKSKILLVLYSCE